MNRHIVDFKTRIFPRAALLALGLGFAVAPAQVAWRTTKSTNNTQNTGACTLENGTLRIGAGMPFPAYSPAASWIAAQGRAGQAWGWLSWQSGAHWGELIDPAIADEFYDEPHWTQAILTAASELESEAVVYMDPYLRAEPGAQLFFARQLIGQRADDVPADEM